MIPTITIRRTNNVTPNGSEVLISGHRVEGLHSFDWHVETSELDVVTLRIKGHVRVEHFDAPNTERVNYHGAQYYCHRCKLPHDHPVCPNCNDAKQSTSD